MNRKAKYWTIGILVAILVLSLLWVFATGDEQDGVSGASSGNMDHSGMNHASAGVANESGAADLDHYLQEQDAVMAKMMTDMAAVEKSGSASLDFLNGMIPHHQSAVEMAQSYLKNGGTEPRLQKIANDIIETQTREIEQMKTMMQQLQDAGQKEETAEAYWTEYDKLFTNHHMGHAVSVPQSMDAAFAQGMIEHHQMAVDMAKAIVDYSENKDVKQMAQSMIDAQEDEIGQMRAILADLQPAG